MNNSNESKNFPKNNSMYFIHLISFHPAHKKTFESFSNKYSQEHFLSILFGKYDLLILSRNDLNTQLMNDEMERKIISVHKVLASGIVPIEKTRCDSKSSWYPIILYLEPYLKTETISKSNNDEHGWIIGASKCKLNKDIKLTLLGIKQFNLIIKKFKNNKLNLFEVLIKFRDRKYINKTMDIFKIQNKTSDLILKSAYNHVCGYWDLKLLVEGSINNYIEFLKELKWEYILDFLTNPLIERKDL